MKRIHFLFDLCSFFHYVKLDDEVQPLPLAVCQQRQYADLLWNSSIKISCKALKLLIQGIEIINTENMGILPFCA